MKLRLTTAGVECKLKGSPEACGRIASMVLRFSSVNVRAMDYTELRVNENDELVTMDGKRWIEP